jgi:hypothetical protein
MSTPSCFSALARNRGSQLGPTDLFERRQFFSHEFPHDGRGDLSVVVPQDIPDPCDLCPGDVGMPGLQLLDEPLLLPVGFEAFECGVAQYTSDALDRLDDVGQTRDEGANCH